MRTIHSTDSSSSVSKIGARVAILLITFSLQLAAAVPAQAQLSRLGTNPLLLSTGVRGTDAAYDPVNNVYLVVGAYGQVWGVFTNTSGSPLSSLQINTTAAFAHYPRVVYSPSVNNGAGGFVVTWHESSGGPNLVNTRVITYPGGPVTGQQTIAAPVGTWWESGAAIAYSATSRVFLITWRSGDYLIWGARLDANGTLIGSAFQISLSGEGARDPSVAWNSATDQFGVVYTGWGGSGTQTTVTLVSPSGAALARNTFSHAGASGTYITDVAYNSATNRFVAVWYQTGAGTLGAEVGADANVVAVGPVSTSTGTYDGMGLAYNPVSGTFLLVGSGASYDVWGAELNARGARTSSDTAITSAGGTQGAFYPRTTARPNAAQWNATFSHNFNEIRDQVIATSTTGGGPAASLGGAAPTPTTPSGSCPGSAPFPGAVCVNGGWVPGGSTGGTTTGSCVGTAPFAGAICVNGGWVPGGTTSTGSCPGTAPFAGAICVNGGWVPGGTTSGGTTSSGSCPGTAPFAGAICVNGGWVAGGTTSGGTTSTGSCPGRAPFPGAVCVNGGWVPGGTTSGGTASTGSCLGTAPFPGAVCVNGGWVPGGATSTGSCPGTAPFPGAVCVNGGWVPGGAASTGSCPGSAPFPGAVCVNGGWVPGGTTVSGSCLGTAPFPGAVCVNGGWVPGSTTTSSGGCTTPDPFTAIGGGVCTNGGWKPRSH